MKKAFFTVSCHNTCVYLGEFETKAQAKAYWANKDRTLLEILKSGKVKVMTVNDMRKEVINVIKAGSSGNWETTRIIAFLNVIKGANLNAVS